MGNKYKPWQNPERRPKKFRKLSSLGQPDFDPNDRRSQKEKRHDKNRNWQTDWHKED